MERDFYPRSFIRSVSAPCGASARVSTRREVMRACALANAVRRQLGEVWSVCVDEEDGLVCFSANFSITDKDKEHVHKLIRFGKDAAQTTSEALLAYICTSCASKLDSLFKRLEASSNTSASSVLRYYRSGHKSYAVQALADLLDPGLQDQLTSDSKPVLERIAAFQESARAWQWLGSALLRHSWGVRFYGGERECIDKFLFGRTALKHWRNIESGSTPTADQKLQLRYLFKREIRGAVYVHLHAELYVIRDVIANHHDPCCRRTDLIIGCHKLCCYLCWLFIQAVNNFLEKNHCAWRVVVAGTHGKHYPMWKLPIFRHAGQIFPRFSSAFELTHLQRRSMPIFTKPAHSQPGSQEMGSSTEAEVKLNVQSYKPGASS